MERIEWLAIYQICYFFFLLELKKRKLSIIIPFINLHMVVTCDNYFSDPYSTPNFRRIVIF
jgi:hypothetical protein